MMIEKIGEPAMLEQLAEECTELEKAALKKARILRNENPTPVTLEEADENLVEEYCDMEICIGELKIHPSPYIYQAKRTRFLKRWHEKEVEADAGDLNG